MTVKSDIQAYTPGALVEMFVIDYASLGGSAVYIHAGKNALTANVVWQGQTYTAFPFEASGFERSGRGTLPQPKFRVSNIDGSISALCRTYDDLVGAKVTRKRAFYKYLDAVNYAGGVNASADPTQYLPDEIWYVNRKAEETSTYIDFELASSMDVAGKAIPGRQCIANICGWLAIGGYRGPYCGYAGGAVADINDVPTSVLASDACGGRLTSCKLRFGQFAQLPFGGFVGAGLVR